MTTSDVIRVRISVDEFEALTHVVLGMPVSRTWKGVGTTLFLELGALSPGHYKNGLRGESTLMIMWDWRVERARSVAFGTADGRRRMTNGIAGLVGPTVEAITTDGSPPEITVALSDGRRVRSFVATRGQPEWALFLPDGSWLCVKRGRIVRERTTPGATKGQ